MLRTTHELEFSVRVFEHEFDCESRIIKKTLVFSVFLGDSEIQDSPIRAEFSRMIEESPEEFELEFDPDFAVCCCNSRSCINK